MAYFRKCERCNCTLDPGEGRLCSECALQEELRLERAKEVLSLLEEDKRGQMKIASEEKEIT